MIEGRQSTSRKQNETNKTTTPKGYNKKGYTCMTVLQQYLRGNASLYHFRFPSLESCFGLADRAN